MSCVKYPKQLREEKKHFTRIQSKPKIRVENNNDNSRFSKEFQIKQ